MYCFLPGVCVCVKRLGHTCVPGCPVPLYMLPACTPVRTCPLIRWPSPQGAFSRCYKLTDMSTSAVFALKVVPRGGAGAGCLRTQGKVRVPSVPRARSPQHFPKKALPFRPSPGWT